MIKNDGIEEHKSNMLIITGKKAQQMQDQIQATKNINELMVKTTNTKVNVMLLKYEALKTGHFIVNYLGMNKRIVVMFILINRRPVHPSGALGKPCVQDAVRRMISPTDKPAQIPNPGGEDGIA